MNSKMLAVGSKWTATADGPDRHFEVLSIDRSRVELRCVVTHRCQSVDRASLSDRDQWLPGWRQLGD